MPESVEKPESVKESVVFDHQTGKFHNGHPFESMDDDTLQEIVEQYGYDTVAGEILRKRLYGGELQKGLFEKNKSEAKAAPAQSEVEQNTDTLGYADPVSPTRLLDPHWMKAALKGSLLSFLAAGAIIKSGPVVQGYQDWQHRRQVYSQDTWQMQHEYRAQLEEVMDSHDFLIETAYGVDTNNAFDLLRLMPMENHKFGLYPAEEGWSLRVTEAGDRDGHHVGDKITGKDYVFNPMRYTLGYARIEILDAEGAIKGYVVLRHETR